MHINTLLHTFPCYHEETFKAFIFIVFIHLVRSITPILSLILKNMSIYKLHAVFISNRYKYSASYLLYKPTAVPTVIARIIIIMIRHIAWPCGPMDKASDFESGDCRFESCQGRFCSQVHVSTLFFTSKRI